MVCFLLLADLIRSMISDGMWVLIRSSISSMSGKEPAVAFTELKRSLRCFFNSFLSRFFSALEISAPFPACSSLSVIGAMVNSGASSGVSGGFAVAAVRFGRLGRELLAVSLIVLFRELLVVFMVL